MTSPKTYTAFFGERRLASGALDDVLRAIQAAQTPVALVFADDTGDLIKLNTPADVAEALVAEALAMEGAPPPKPVCVEVRLLPRHLDWLQAQPGGPSAAMRRLVDAARRDRTGRARQAREAAYRFISMLAGDFPGFETASRALFAGDRACFEEAAASWPSDVQAYGLSLAGEGLT
ncbi:MAG TPA: DUF2239 family protein [Caulobacteraceae bacterium]